MTNYNFGKDITREFIAYENGEPIELPSQVPAIYLFSSQPSMADALAGTGAVRAAITTWAQQSIPPYKRIYTHAAIEDPDSDGSTPSLGYWEAIRFIAKTSGAYQVKIREFDVERAGETDSYSDVTVQDLKDVFPAISSYGTDAELSDQIGVALEEFKLYFKSKGIEWHKLHNLRETKLYLAYKAIALNSIGEIKQQGDRFQLRYDEFEKKAATILGMLKLPYDSDDDGKPDSTTDTKTNQWWVSR